MKKGFRRRVKWQVKSRYSQMGEDMQVLQQMISNRSVYKTAKAQVYERRQKHRPRYLDYIEV